MICILCCMPNNIQNDPSATYTNQKHTIYQCNFTSELLQYCRKEEKEKCKHYIHLLTQI